MSNRQNLSNWLQAELHSRDWSQSELARVSGLHRAIISKIILQGSDPTPETLEAIAKAFKIPPEQVYRIAGILPPIPDEDPWIKEQEYKLRMISPKNRGIAGKLIDTLVQGEEAEIKLKSKAKPAKA